jgi:hypothetical protein
MISCAPSMPFFRNGGAFAAAAGFARSAAPGATAFVPGFEADFDPDFDADFDAASGKAFETAFPMPLADGVFATDLRTADFLPAAISSLLLVGLYGLRFSRAADDTASVAGLARPCGARFDAQAMADHNPQAERSCSRCQSHDRS